MKPEKVQSYKEIILQNRDTGDFFGGRIVRDKLGIPYDQDGRVTPGNLGDWIIWVQSTSNNRNFLRDMKLLYDLTPVIPKLPSFVRTV